MFCLFLVCTIEVGKFGTEWRMCGTWSVVHGMKERERGGMAVRTGGGRRMYVCMYVQEEEGGCMYVCTYRRRGRLYVQGEGGEAV